jgi:TatD DNase family protein
VNADDKIFIDTHCHLDDPRLCDRLTEVMAAAEKNGVRKFIIPGVEPRGWEKILLLAEKDERISAAPGVHPMKAEQWNLALSEILKGHVSEIVSIGEIGLDYSNGMPPHELQQDVFRAQLQIAREAALPVIIHCRKAFADTLKILAEERIKDFGGVMHAFSGSVEVARTCISLGIKIGISGTVTWRKAIRPFHVVKAISLEHLLLETDSPDLSPEQYRGRVNEPAFMLDIAVKVAEIKGVSVEEVAAITSGNAELLFGLNR